MMTVAVLGMGSIGQAHATALASLPDVRVVAVPVRPRKIEGVTTVGSLAEAVKVGATAVVVATDTARHHNDVLLALGLGLDVLIEKPVAIDAAQGHDLQAAVTRAGRRAYVGYVLRFDPCLQRVRQLLPRIGALHSVRIECQSYLPDWRPDRPFADSYSAREADGGVLRDLSHEIDYAGWLFGWPTALQAVVLNTGRLGIGAEELVSLQWTSPDGAIVSIHLDYLTRPTRRRLVACGAGGVISADLVTGDVDLSVPGADPLREQHSVARLARLAAQDASFVRALTGGVEVALASLRDGINGLAVCDAARHSSTTQTAVAVRYSPSSASA